MTFNPENYTNEQLISGNDTIEYRAYTNISYVKNPAAPELQTLNIFIPKAYLEGGEINGYTAKTAPIFFPNGIGGYMEARPCHPCMRENGFFSTEAAALARGYVVVSAGARGRTTRNGEKYTGKAPACIVDLKAAVRFIRSIADKICGDVNKIISNGTSAGGAMSALLGASGDSPLYTPFLEALGAENTSDRIFAASCYCPITNLENADTAYEWQYGHLSEQYWHKWEQEGDGWKVTPVQTLLSTEQMALSAQLKKQFPRYLNSISPNGLTLDENGGGSFKNYIEKLIIASAQKAHSEGAEIPPESGINLAENTIDFPQYCGYITRMKAPCAFDNPDMYTPENQLFGDENTDKKHFTQFGASADKNGAETAPKETVALMNAMNFTANEGCAMYWRIRHGASDRDTSFAISAMLAQCLTAEGKSVDYFLPWGVPHSGDYDLDELFDWIDGIVKGEKE